MAKAGAMVKHTFLPEGRCGWDRAEHGFQTPPQGASRSSMAGQ